LEILVDMLQQVDGGDDVDDEGGLDGMGLSMSSWLFHHIHR
jgi:hypothetical protein